MARGGSKIRGLEIGDRFQNKEGKWYTISEINSCKNVVVTFDERGVKKVTTSNYAKKGILRFPLHFIGETFTDMKGNIVTVVELPVNRVVLEWSDGYRRNFQASVLVTKHILREEDSTRLNPKVQVGCEFTTKQGYKVVVERILKGRKCIVRFDEPFTFTKEAHISNVVKGNIDNQHMPSLSGFGILGDVEVDVSGKMYRSYAGMLKRCYGNDIPANYIDCEVCSEWKYIDNFSRWFDTQIVQDNWQLDKDLLVKGNTVYSPSTCVFLPKVINTFLTDRANHRGDYPIGVTYHERIDKYQASCCERGHQNYLGVYKTAEEAFFVYKKEKERLAKVLAEEWKGIIDEKAYNALISFTVDIND